jgi:hypothetical protein
MTTVLGSIKNFAIGIDPAMTSDSRGITIISAVQHGQLRRPLVEVLELETLQPPQSADTIVNHVAAMLRARFIGGPRVRIVTDIGGRGLTLALPLRAAFPEGNLVFVELNGGSVHGYAARAVPAGMLTSAAMVWSVSRTQLLTDLNAAADDRRLSFSKDINPEEIDALRAAARGASPVAGANHKLRVKTGDGDNVLFSLTYAIYGITYHADWRDGIQRGPIQRAPYRNPAPSPAAWT